MPQENNVSYPSPKPLSEKCINACVADKSFLMDVTFDTGNVLRGIIREVIACTLGVNRALLGLKFIHTKLLSVETCGKNWVTRRACDNSWASETQQTSISADSY